jgi:hypothetical protein
MSIEQRIKVLERAAGSETEAVDGHAVRAAVIDLLSNHPDIIESLRVAEMVQDCDLSEPCAVDFSNVIAAHVPEPEGDLRDSAGNRE